MTWHRRFFWLLLLFLPSQLGVHFWPDWAGVLGRRVDYLSPTVYFTDVLIGLIIILWFLASVKRIMKYELGIMGKTKTLFTIIHNSRFILLFLGLVTVNIFVARNYQVAIYKWIKVVEFLVLGWYVVRTKPSLSLVTFPLSLGILYSSLLAIAQFFLQHSVGGLLWWLGERTFTVDTPGIARYDFNVSLFTFHFSLFGLRPYATFPHPNVLGGFLAVVLPLLIIRPIRPMNESMVRMFQWITMALGIIALFLTFSRSAIVVGAIAIALAIARIRKYELRIMVITLCVIILTSYFILHASTDESVVVRVALNDATIRLWKTAPLFGVGLGNFLVRLPEVLTARTIYFLQPVHNIYLLLLSEVGLVGIGLIAMWVVSRVKYELRIMKYGKRKTKSIIHTSLFIILILGFVDHYPLTLQQGQLMLTLLIAMILR